MSRLGRWYAPNVPQHIIQRGNNRQPVFFKEEDYRAYLDWLADVSAEHGLRIHAYALMTNHVHLFATPGTAESIPHTMQKLGRLYVRAVNRAYGRTGTLWEGRYRATVVEAESYALTLMRYIEMNPVRAGIVTQPRNYRWSSFARNGLGKEDKVVTPHDIYNSLGRTDEARQDSYRSMFRAALGDEKLAIIRAGTNAGWAIGGERFANKVAAKAGRRANPLQRGGDRRSQGDDE